MDETVARLDERVKTLERTIETLIPEIQRELKELRGTLIKLVTIMSFLGVVAGTVLGILFR